MFPDAIENGVYTGTHPTAGVSATFRADEIDVDADDDDKRAFTIAQLHRVSRTLPPLAPDTPPSTFG